MLRANWSFSGTLWREAGLGRNELGVPRRVGPIRKRHRDSAEITRLQSESAECARNRRGSKNSDVGRIPVTNTRRPPLENSPPANYARDEGSLLTLRVVTRPRARHRRVLHVIALYWPRARHRGLRRSLPPPSIAQCRPSTLYENELSQIFPATSYRNI